MVWLQTASSYKVQTIADSQILKEKKKKAVTDFKVWNKLNCTSEKEKKKRIVLYHCTADMQNFM